MSNTEVVVNQVPDTVSFLFEEQFSISSFKEVVQKTEDETSEIVDQIRDIVKCIINNDTDGKYVLDIDDDVKAALKDQEVEFVFNKNGEMLAQLRNAKGQLVKNIPVKKELEDAGITPEMINMAIQMEAVKAKLNEIIDEIKELESNVLDVRMGQRNDRLGLFYSGLSLYLEAQRVKDNDLKKQILAQAIKSISDANAQMIQEIRTSMDYLFNKKYLRTKKASEKVEEHLDNIKQCYGIVYRSSFLKATIYQKCGELQAMAASIYEYSRFVNNLVLPNVGKLSELDKSTSLIDKGAWSQIANSLESCSDIYKIVSSETPLILLLEGEKDAC